MIWPSDFVNKVICGDCLDILSLIPDESIDFICTDPPWMISQEIKIGRSSNTKYAASTDIDLDYGEWDHWDSEGEYYEWTFQWLEQAIRVLKDYRHIMFFFDKKKVTPIWEWMEEHGMMGRSPAYWRKTNPVPRGRKVDWMKSLEMALWFTRKAVKQDHYNWALGQTSDVVEAAIPGHPRLHPTQKPVTVLAHWLRYLSNPGDIILDPFCGSGSTLVAAKQNERKYIGIELSEEYYNITLNRMSQTQSPLLS